MSANFHHNVKTIDDVRQALQRLRVLQNQINTRLEELEDAVIAAEDVTFEPSGELQSENVQDALEELDDEKASEEIVDDDKRKFRALVVALVEQKVLELPPVLEEDFEQGVKEA